jgi:membrane associated rhomboid family serine protease
MAKKFGLYIVLGMLIGMLFGASFTPVVENDMLAILGGALAGVFIGWFVAAAVRERMMRKQDKK